MVSIVTDVSNVTGPVSFLQWMNWLSGMNLGWIFLVTVFLVLFIGMKAFDTDRALAASLFITACFAVLLGAMGLVGSGMLVGAVLGLALSLLSLRWSHD